ncbi:uncharacterized protein LOC121811829 isoform X2 [Haplochromis burtoni]|uniref:uncharacterized protein LOC121811829 isoform X2 n=1 Tax=Haplochromis burtoni TaxID=8153 RepID=UPI001C2D4D7F|nr:uncharacterized protein LOC121811829 isoform X2 [Haplochromis burtoni]
MKKCRKMWKVIFQRRMHQRSHRSVPQHRDPKDREVSQPLSLMKHPQDPQHPRKERRRDLTLTTLKRVHLTPTAHPVFTSGTSKEKESDTDATKMGPPGFKQGQWTTDEPDGDHPTTGTSKKRTWTSAEVHAVEKTLMSFIESGKVPGKSECVACIEASPKALKNRTWTGVKFYVKNRITAMQRKAAKRV